MVLFLSQECISRRVRYYHVFLCQGTEPFQVLSQEKVDQMYGDTIYRMYHTLSELKLEGTLQLSFGYTKFRSQQEAIVKSTLSGHDSFVLMPTGAGKSICFQLYECVGKLLTFRPALILPGITIVVSPLIALMVRRCLSYSDGLKQDQVAALKAKSIKAEFYNSSMSQAEKTRVGDDLKAKAPNTKLLYVTPELIATSGFLSTLHSLNNRGLLSSVAVDEVRT